jgi:hypothetical protein
MIAGRAIGSIAIKKPKNIFLMRITVRMVTKKIRQAKLKQGAGRHLLCRDVVVLILKFSTNLQVQVLVLAD